MLDGTARLLLVLDGAMFKSTSFILQAVNPAYRMQTILFDILLLSPIQCTSLNYLLDQGLIQGRVHMEPQQGTHPRKLANVQRPSRGQRRSA